MIKAIRLASAPAARVSLLAAALLAGLARTGQAQVVELEAGVGHVLTGAPAVPVFEVGAVVWPLDWGVAARIVRGPGEDLRNPIPGGDRTFLGSGHVRAWTMTARYRWRAAGVEIGAGIASRRYDDIVMLHFVDPYFPDAPARRSVAIGWGGGVTLEALYKRTLWRHVGIKAGLAYDMWVEGRNPYGPSSSRRSGPDSPC